MTFDFELPLSGLKKKIHHDLCFFVVQWNDSLCFYAHSGLESSFHQGAGSNTNLESQLGIPQNDVFLLYA